MYSTFFVVPGKVEISDVFCRPGQVEESDAFCRPESFGYAQDKLHRGIRHFFVVQGKVEISYVFCRPERSRGILIDDSIRIWSYTTPRVLAVNRRLSLRVTK